VGYEPGNYLFKVIGQGFGENKSGSQFFFLEGEPVALQKDGQEYEVESGKRTIRLTITEKNVSYVIDKLTSIGWEGGRWGTLNPDEPNHHSFVGQEVQARCKMQPGTGENAGKLFENWDLPFSGESLENDPNVSRKLDQMFGKSAAAAKKPAARKPASKPNDDANRAMQEAAANTEGDDIPF
jgi:hypothetical protein